MRRRIAIAAFVLAVAAAPARAGAAAPSCASPLPSVPVGVPAPVVFRTSCGSYRAEDGAIARSKPVRSPWWSPSPFLIAVRRDHVVLIEHGKVRWRSRRRFPLPVSELGSVAVSRTALAFSFGRGRLWVSPMRGHEHAVARGEGALTWTAAGDLLTVHSRHGSWRLAVRDRAGLHPRVIARGTPNFLVDEATRTLLYVTPSRSLVRTDGRSKRTLADLGALGFDGQAELTALPHELVGISSAERLAVVRGDGSVFATMAYPVDAAGLRHGWAAFAVSADRVAAAVELDRPAPGGTAGEDLYLLRPGETQGTLLARFEDAWVGCGWMVTLGWHGAWLLYSDSVADVLALDTDGGARVDLSATARRLPGIVLDETSNEYAGFDFAAWG